MNPVGLYFASGDSIYLGAALLVLSILFSPYLKHRRQLRLRNLSAWLALAMMVMASPPFPWTLVVMFLAAFVLWHWAVNQSASRANWATPRRAITVILLALLLILSAGEFSHRLMPAISGEPSDHLVIIGDSISSGIDTHVLPWPSIFQQMTGVPVRNLARPGAQTRDGLAIAESVTSEDRLVLLEIGGNDLLSGVPSSEFDHALDELLSRLASPRRSVVMFELPLLPNKIAYGQIQRRLSRKYGVVLIPKRYFCNVLGSVNATSDGLHLSQIGAQHMADLVARLLAKVLKSPAAHNS
jgi:acyl-CoA thioesterase I